MCRNIKNLYNFDPPATDSEIRDASLQFVRKLTGFNTPSKQNEEVFNNAIQEVSEITRKLFDSLATHSEPKNREIEAEKHRTRIAARFSTDKYKLTIGAI